MIKYKPQPDLTLSDHAAAEAMAIHISDVLALEHDSLGRSGPICPYIKEGLSRGLIYISISAYEGAHQGDLLQAMKAVADDFTLWQGSTRPEHRVYASLVVVLPRLVNSLDTVLVKQVQEQAKLFYVRKGLMIGEFYPDCNAPGLHNPAFRPLRAPVLSLAVRNLTLFDAPFMMEDEACIAEYVARFGAPGGKRIDRLRRSSALDVCPYSSGALTRAVETLSSTSVQA